MLGTPENEPLRIKNPMPETSNADGIRLTRLNRGETDFAASPSGTMPLTGYLLGGKVVPRTPGTLRAPSAGLQWYARQLRAMLAALPYGRWLILCHPIIHITARLGTYDMNPILLRCSRRPKPLPRAAQEQPADEPGSHGGN